MRLRNIALLSAALAVVHASPAFADTPASYGDQGGYTITPPYDPSSFTTALTAFPTATTRVVDGYPLASRLLAASGRTIWLQQTFGASNWLTVAILDPSDFKMDPAFLEITPDGETIALGVGLGKPLYVFPASILSVASPADLTTNPKATVYDGLSYYSAAFHDNRYLFVDEGGAELGESDIYVIDTKDPGARPVPAIAGIPGASSGIAFDAQGDLVTGIGWDADDSRTGEIKIFDAASIAALLGGGNPLDYDSTGAVVVEGALSADSLGFDASGNLDVGGGDAFGSSGHYGYAEIISTTVISRVLTGGPPADPSDPDDVAIVAPDPCKNDDWTGITYVPGVESVVVTATMASSPPNCASMDTTMGPGTASLYFPPDAPDHDGNGIPDGADPGYEAQEFYGRDELSRLVNALDATSSDSNYDASVDYDASGKIDDTDYAYLRAHWGQPVNNP